MSWKEFISLGVLGTALFLTFASMDLFEKLVELAKSHEDWELDELVLVIPVVTFLLAIFTTNRIIQLRRESRARMAAEAEALRIATINTTTGLPNESEILRLADEALSGAGGRTPVSALIIRHNLRRKFLRRTGEEDAATALADFISRTRRTLPLKSIIGSLDNDSLMVFSPGMAADARSQKLIEALATALGEPVEAGGISIRVKNRIGVAYQNTGNPADVLDATGLFSRALRALEEQPVTNLSAVTVFDVKLDQELVKRRETFKQLRLAIENDETDCVFQPIIDLASGATVAFEALARWTPKGGEPVPPDVFIPMLEKAGLIDGFTDAVLDKALRCARALPEDIGMAVNVSRLQLMDPQLYMRIFQRIQRYGITARRLELEVTETQDLGEVATSRQSIVALRALGVRVAIDDFGAGFSNLHVLTEIDFDRIKIDRKFIKDIRKSPKNRAIVEATIAMTLSLRRSLTAEGIEDEATADLLKQIGCERGQGYFFGKPMSADDAVAFVKRRPGPGLDYRKAAKLAEPVEKTAAAAKFPMASAARERLAQVTGSARSAMERPLGGLTPTLKTKG
ncbi:MAG: EAL domain-containing protein [Beijerinckiaceae bacterium]